MSTIHNSMEYYQSNQGLLSMLNSKKSGNALIDQIISNNDLKFQRKMESMGLSASGSNSKYKNVDKAANNLLDALEKLDDKSLYEAEAGKEYDVTDFAYDDEYVKNVLGVNERTSVKLSVSDNYKETFKNLKTYIEQENKELNDKDLNSEIEIINTLI